MPRVKSPSIGTCRKRFLEGASYGQHGFFVQEHRGLAHPAPGGGTINGFGAFLVLVPEKRFAVIASRPTKRRGVRARRRRRRWKLSCQAATETTPVAPAQKMPPMTRRPRWKIVAGTYRTSRTCASIIFVRDGKPIAEGVLQDVGRGGAGPRVPRCRSRNRPRRFPFTPPGSEAERFNSR